MIRRIVARVAVVTALVGAVALVPVASADAAFIAAICNDQNCTGGGDVITFDGLAGDLNPAQAGNIILLGSAPGFSLTVNVSTSVPVLADPSIDLNFTAAGVGEVWFYASANGLTSTDGLAALLGGTIVPPGAGTVEAFVLGGTDNSLFSLLPVIGTSGVISDAAFSASFPVNTPTANPFGLTLGVHIVRNEGTGITTGDFSVVPVPEPATVLLLGAGLLTAGALYRRRG